MHDDEFFIDFVAKQLVEYPEDVRVERKTDDKGVLISLTVNPADLGRIIGKRGTTANSLRHLLRALGMRNNAHYGLKIIDVNGVRERSHNYGEEEVNV